MNKHKPLPDYIFKNYGIQLSPFLASLIENPQKLTNLNKVALTKAVTEFAPIYKQLKYTLDGTDELMKINTFYVSLSPRLHNKPTLERLL